MSGGDPRPVIMDTDPGIDETLALMLAWRSPEIRVVLLTTVAGNVPVRVSTANAARLLAFDQSCRMACFSPGRITSMPSFHRLELLARRVLH